MADNDNRPINQKDLLASGSDASLIDSQSLATANLMLHCLQSYEPLFVAALQANFSPDDVRRGARLVYHYLFPNGAPRKNHEKLAAKFLLMDGQKFSVVVNMVDRSEEWVAAFINDGGGVLGVETQKSGRASNGRKAVISTKENIEYIAMVIKGPPPYDESRWKGRHVAEVLKAHLGVKDIDEKRGIEILSAALKINRNNSARNESEGP